MDALLMCGGKGSRLDTAVEKPLFEIGGEPMVDRVRAALAGSRVETTHAVVSPNAPATRRHLDDWPTIETPGEGYVEDLERALAVVDPPVLTVAADLPLLAPELVDRTLDATDRERESAAPSVTVCVPAALKRRLGVSCETTFERDGRELAPTGLNVVGERGERLRISHDARLAVNVNRNDDAAVAESLRP